MKCKYGRSGKSADCELCSEFKKCEYTVRKENKTMKMVPLYVEPEQTVYLVLCAKRAGEKENIVFRAKVTYITINRYGTTYHCRADKVVVGTDKNIDNCVNGYSFLGANVDTGFGTGGYAVFTTKEKCISWLKGK